MKKDFFTYRSFCTIDSETLTPIKKIEISWNPEEFQTIVEKRQLNNTTEELNTLLFEGLKKFLNENEQKTI